MKRILAILMMSLFIVAVMAVTASTAFAQGNNAGNCCQQTNGGGNTPNGNANGVPYTNNGGQTPGNL